MEQNNALAFQTTILREPLIKKLGGEELGEALGREVVEDLMEDLEEDLRDDLIQCEGKLYMEDKLGHSSILLQFSNPTFLIGIFVEISFPIQPSLSEYLRKACSDPTFLIGISEGSAAVLEEDGSAAVQELLGSAAVQELLWVSSSARGHRVGSSAQARGTPRRTSPRRGTPNSMRN